MNLSNGQVLAGKYRLIRRLGEGGMGCVWVAEQLHLDRQVAIKVIGNRVISEPSARERFEVEARATAKVESPHVVQVLDFDYTDEGQPFLVLELLVGETLEQRISREGPLSLVDARELLKQTTHALSEAHHADIFHRDIKAENLFLIARDELFVKLLDFGIALRRDRTSLTGHTTDPTENSPIGTPLYMSPEQTTLMGSIDERSDLYSLGVSMYYTLTGQFPFNAETLAVLAFAQQREDFKLPSHIRPELGPSLDAFFVRALAFHPEDRFQSAEKMFDAFDRAFERAVNGERTTEEAPSTPSIRAAAQTIAHGRTRRALKPRKTSVAILAFAAAGSGFFLAPRLLQNSMSQSLSKAAVWSASRIPSAKVAAAEETDATSTEPARSLDVSGATLALPIRAATALPAATGMAAPASNAIGASTRSSSHHAATKKADPKKPDEPAPQVAVAPPVEPISDSAKIDAGAPPKDDTTPAPTDPWPGPSAPPAVAPTSSSEAAPAPSATVPAVVATDSITRY